MGRREEVYEKPFHVDVLLFKLFDVVDVVDFSDDVSVHVADNLFDELEENVVEELFVFLEQDSEVFHEVLVVVVVEQFLMLLVYFYWVEL